MADIKQILRFALPALAAGIAGRQGARGGTAFNAYTDNALRSRQQNIRLRQEREQMERAAQQQAFSQNRATEQDRLQAERYRLQDARQATMDKLSMDRERRLIDAEAANQAWRAEATKRAEAARARARMSSLTKALQGAAKNKDFFDMIEKEGPDRFSVLSEEGPVPVVQAMQELGLGPDPKMLRNVLNLVAPEEQDEEELYEYTFESSPGVTSSAMLTKAQRARMGTLVKNRERATEAAKPRVSVSRDIFGESTSKFSYGGSEIELSREEVLDMMEKSGNYDLSKIDEVMRDPEELQHLLGYGEP